MYLQYKALPVIWSELTGLGHHQTSEMPVANLPINTEFITPSVIVLLAKEAVSINQFEY